MAGVVKSEELERYDFGDYSSADALLAYELNQLSVQERDQLNEEIHGVLDQSQHETPELIKNSLEQMNVELSNLPDSPSKKAYETALQHPESYVHTDDFRLIFLRCEFFNTRKAAERYMHYLDLINYAFGEKVLQRDIRLSDFDEESMKFVRMGYQQILPGMDRTGRRIGGNFAFKVNHSVPLKARIRSTIYVCIQLAKSSVSVQRRGVVGVFWTLGFMFNDMTDRAEAHKRIMPGIPVRFSAIHCCVPARSDALLKMINAMYLMAIGPENRKRVRLHTGSATECLYKLQTFGIQSLQMPINTNTGKIKTVNHHKWLELQRCQDEAHKSNKKFKGIECPEQRDVLFGRGWPKMHHPGNALFRDTIDSRLDEYNAASSKRDKTMIAWSIVAQLKESGVRFLKEDTSGWWIEVSNDVARQKVSIGFRDVRKARQKSSSNTTNGECCDMPSSCNGEAPATFLPQVKSLSFKRKAASSGHDCGNSSEEDTLSPYAFMDASKRPQKRCNPCAFEEI